MPETDMAVEAWDDVAPTGLSKATMENGTYQVRVTKWKGKPYEKGDQKGVILDLTLDVVGVADGLDEAKYLGQEPFKEAWWLTRPDSKRIFFDELKSIGFDTDSWSNDRADPLFKGLMMPLAVKYMKLRGLTLLLKRSESADKKYSNLKFVGRVGEAGGDEVKTIPNDAVLAVKDEPESAEDVF